MFHILSDYCSLLRKFRTEYASKSDSETLRSLFTESLTQDEMYEHFCDILSQAQKTNVTTFLRNLLTFLNSNIFQFAL